MTELTADLIQERFNRVRERITIAAQRVDRNPEGVKLVVVTKTHPVETVLLAVDAGVRCLGENYADEAVPKITAIQFPALEWHMIGHIQSRKAQLVSRHFTCVHSLDSVKLALRLDRFASLENRVLPVLLECNASGEEAKYGWDITHEENWKNLLPEFEQITRLTSLQVEGLMTMAPYTEQPETVRPYYRRLRRFQAFLKTLLPQANWDELSMGMSGDFEVAIEEGATCVRVGQAIMGPRRQKKEA